LNLKAQNIYLLSKWLHKLINEDGIWQEFLRKEYLNNSKTIGEVKWKQRRFTILVRPYKGQRSLPLSLHF
jgi:hypothetical protein